MSKQFFAKAEFKSRQRKVREAMEKAGIELLLVIAPVHINYLIGATAKGYQEFQVLFFPLEPGPLMIQSRLPEAPMLLADSLVDEVRGWGGREPEDPIEVFKEILTAKGYKGLRTGLEVPNYYLHPHHHNQLVDLLGDDLMMDATDLIGNIKLVKSPAEIDYVRRAGAILDQGMQTCIESIAVGKTERAISADIHHTLLAAGSDIQASPMNFLSGPRSAFAHGEPSDRVLEIRRFHAHSIRRALSQVLRHHRTATVSRRTDSAHAGRLPVGARRRRCLHGRDARRYTCYRSTRNREKSDCRWWAGCLPPAHDRLCRRRGVCTLVD